MTLSSSVRDGLLGFEGRGTHAAGSGRDPERQNKGRSRRTRHISTASLELKATKENAHNGWVMSVGYNSDGDKIVSCGQDGTIKVWDADTLQLVEERKGDGSALDASGSGAVAERNGATLRLKEGGGVFYAPGPLQSVAVHWPRLVAGAQSGELYHLEVQG